MVIRVTYPDGGVDMLYGWTDEMLVRAKVMGCRSSYEVVEAPAGTCPECGVAGGSHDRWCAIVAEKEID